MKFADNLKLVREQRHMTQSAVAEKLHVARQTVSSWENERSYPDIGMLVKISEVYQLSIDQLLKEDMGMLKHYEQQTARNQRSRRINYYLMVVATFLSYLMTFTGWDNWSVGVIVMVTLIVTVLNVSFQNFGDTLWGATVQQRWQFVGLVVMILLLNVALGWQELTGQGIVVPSGVTFEAGYTTGALMGSFVRLFIRTAGVVLAIKLPLNREV